MKSEARSQNTERRSAPASYVLVLWNRRKRAINVGSLGRIEFEPGFYLYVGSGGVNPVLRVQRHLRPSKPLRWHIDRLTCGPRRMRPVDSYLFPGEQECRLARKLARRLSVVPGFGSSDCRCQGHLFRCPGIRDLEQALRAVGLRRSA
jgi:sugar fermentation stimulation protein A